MPRVCYLFNYLLAVVAASCITAAHADRSPNIVFILVDDLGWSDVHCYGGDAFDTPNIDQLATEGVRFTDFYAACPVCSPTRAAIQSGQYQGRLHITDFIPGHYRPFEKLTVPFNADHLPLVVETPAETLRRADYVSGYFGKWHLGNPPGRQPSDQGYSVSKVFSGHWIPRNAPKKEQQYGTDVMGDQATRFIEKNKSKPFFLFLSPYAVHIPLHAKAKTVAKYEERLGGKSGPEGPLPSPIYAAMVEHVDTMVGRITQQLDSLELTNDTMIIFTSDNGGLYKAYTGSGGRVTDNGPLRGEKGTVYEGGIRVPLIVKWPGNAAAGTTCDEPTISIDFWPTIAQAAGVGPNDDTQIIDGQSLLPLLTDPNASLARESIYWHYPHYHHMDPAGAIRRGDWKLIRHYDDSPDELYNLASDLGEENNVIAMEQERAAAMRIELDRWLLETEQLMPTKNNKADADRAHEWWNRRNGTPLDPNSKPSFSRNDVR